MFKRFITMVTLSLGAISIAASQTLLLRSPSISATHISFVYGGDIWVADKTGANARRLTINPGVESNPVFSPDGSKIAFSGNYDGNTDVYVVPIEGGEPQRITYHPAADIVRGWLNNDEVYFMTSREFTYSLGSRLYKKQLQGGIDTALPMPEAYQGTPSADGNRWAYIKNTDPTERDRVAFKRYRGGGMPSIWLFDNASHEIETIPGTNSNDVKPVWIGSKVYFLSDREKTVNIFSYDTQSKRIEKLTRFDKYDVRSLQGHGKNLIFEHEGQIKTLELGSNKITTLQINIHPDVLYKRPHYVDIKNQVRAANISPTGQRALFESRGEIFSVPKEKGDARNISNTPGAHDRYPAWSPDGKWISFISDQSGVYQLVLRDQKAEKPARILSLGEGSFYFQPEWSPDSKKLFYSDAHLNLYYIDIASGNIVRVDSDKLGSHTGRTYNHFQPYWSPDSKWIAYVKTLENGASSIFVYNTETKTAHQITDRMSNSRQPVFTRDGKYLIFQASTNIGLTNSGLHMTAYDRSPQYSLYAFILDKKTPSLFKNESDEEKVKEEATEEKKDEKSDKDSTAIAKNESAKSGRKDTKKEESKAVKIDFDDIPRRIISLNMVAGYGSMSGLVDKKLIYARGRSIYSYDLEKLEEKSLVDNAFSFAISADGKKMLYRNAQGYAIVDAGQKVGPEAGKIKLENIKQLVDPAAEWKQIFNEVWSLQKEFFYVENMHGLDWKKIKTKYEKFLPYVNHRSDLGYLLNEMMGEMVVGHNYIYPGDEPSTPSVSTGTLGADFVIDQGRYRIAKIYSTLDWNPKFRAPLSAPNTEINLGDYIIAVNGIELRASSDLYRLLENMVDKQVALKVSKNANGEDATELIVKPISFGDEIALRRQDWVENNRQKVDRASNNQIAYVYMPNTGREGYDAFNRYYFSQMDKKALLIDERNNGGGSVADYVIDLLSRELIAGWGIRDGKSFTTPGNGIFGPKAMIINENAGSGGDMMPYMFRFKGLGKLVGRTTMGILVGISGYPPLLDGGQITSPNFGVFDLKGNYIIENEGVAPDIFVEQTPKELLSGQDPQLEKTVQLLLEEMKSYPYQTITKPKDPIRVK